MMKTAARKQRAAIFVPRRVINGKNNNIVFAAFGVHLHVRAQRTNDRNIRIKFLRIH